MMLRVAKILSILLPPHAAIPFPGLFPCLLLGRSFGPLLPPSLGARLGRSYLVAYGCGLSSNTLARIFPKIPAGAFAVSLATLACTVNFAATISAFTVSNFATAWAAVCVHAMRFWGEGFGVTDGLSGCWLCKFRSLDR